MQITACVQFACLASCPSPQCTVLPRAESRARRRAAPLETYGPSHLGMGARGAPELGWQGNDKPQEDRGDRGPWTESDSASAHLNDNDPKMVAALIC